MNNISSSSLSRTDIETAISNASANEKKELPKTSGATAIHHLENITDSIKAHTRLRPAPSFSDLSERDKLTFASIDEEAAAKIKIVETRVPQIGLAQAHAMKLGDPLTGSLHSEAPINDEINAIQKTADEKKQALLAKVKPVFVETDLSSPEAELHSIFDQLAQKLSAIEKESATNIQAAKNKASAAQALGTRRGMGIAVSSGVEEDKKIAISEIEKTATHQKNILFLQAKKELLNHQQTYFNSLLETYSTQTASSSGAAPTLEKHNQCRQIVAQTFEVEQKILASLDGLKQASEPAVTAAIKAIASADVIRMRALHPFVEHSINVSLDQIEETSTLLGTLSQSKNKFLNTQALTTLHQELDERRASYLAAEPLFNEGSKKVAVNNASYLKNKIDEINSEVARTDVERSKATASDQPLLDQKISLLTNLATALEAAQQAYARIADDVSLKIKIPTAALPTLSPPHAALSELGAQTTSTSKTAGLDLLSKIADFSETENHQLIFGRRGEMELVDQRSPSFVPNTKLAQEGINLARLAVFRDFGARGLQRFDAHFHDKIVALQSPGSQNFLTIGELKEFAQAEDQINPSAFYLSPSHSIAELDTAESTPNEDSKLIKSDKISFNPFSRTTVPDVTVRKDQETIEGLTATRAALKELFKEIPPELRQSILNRFDEKFKTADKKNPLTVGELRSFLKTEAENLKSSHWNVAGPFLYSLVWHTGVTALWTFMMSAHPPAWMMMGIGLSIGVGHDLTSYWRQLRPEED